MVSALVTFMLLCCNTMNKANYRKKDLSGGYNSRGVRVYHHHVQKQSGRHGVRAAAEGSHSDPLTGSREKGRRWRDGG